MKTFLWVKNGILLYCISGLVPDYGGFFYLNFHGGSLFLPSIFRNDLRACSFAVTRHLIPPPRPHPTGDNLHLSIHFTTPTLLRNSTVCMFLKGDFCLFSVLYSLFRHCFICRPSDSTVSEDAGSETRTVGTVALTARRSNRSARSHPLECILFCIRSSE
jgi:hypothetical protein